MIGQIVTRNPKKILDIYIEKKKIISIESYSQLEQGKSIIFLSQYGSLL